MKRSLDKVSTSDVGKANGVCPLGADGKVPQRYVTVDGTTLLSNVVQFDASGHISNEYITQGVGSGLDAEYLAGLSAADFARSTRRVIVQYPLQGGGELRDDVTIGLASEVLNATLDHTKLLNIGTNSHAQLDGFVALATPSPAAGAIPLADASGKLNAWVDIPTLEGFFELDGDGAYQPVENPSMSTMWDLDSNGDIEPIEVV